MSNFYQRTLSGTVYVGLVVASILVHPVFFGLLFLLITGLAIREFHQLMHSSKVLTIGAAIVGCVFFATTWLLYFYDALSDWCLMALLASHFVLMLLLLIAELWLQAPDPIRSWGNLLVSQWMIAFPFASMVYTMHISKYLLLALFILIWVNDSGAYCIGSWMAKRPGGNHKMFPRVSPAKSWEGLVGGFIFAIFVGYIFYTVGWIEIWWQAIVIAIVVALFGTLGDLMESLMKRTIGVKDSGRFMPGHGGVLDRFDSLLLAAPVLALLLFLF